MLACAAASGCRRAEPAAAEDDAGAAPAAGDTGREPRAREGDGPVRILYPAAPGSFVEVTRELGAGVVHLRSPDRVAGGPGDALPGAEDRHALGSGFVIDRDGHILTNAHVIARAREVRVVTAAGDDLPAEVVGRDTRTDVALLSVDATAADLEPVPLGDSEALEVGQWVLAVGNPFGDEIGVSAGVVSSRGRGPALTSSSRPDPRSLIRTDAAISAGLSGGPVVDTAGEVVGIATALDARGRGGGFAVPIARAAEILPMLEEDGAVTRAWLGVFVHPMTEARAADRGMDDPAGALVSEVVAGGPAARAGIRPGDVILAFAGDEVDHRSLPWVAATAGVGRTVPVAVWRDGQRTELELVTAPMPE